MTSKHRITVGEELRYDADLAGLHNLSGTFAQKSSVDVRDYGAVGDGATDDTAAINTAIGACPAGGTVFFPAGKKYIVKKTNPFAGAVVPNKAITLLGPGATIKADPASSTGIRLVAPTASGVRVDGLSFDPSGVSQATCVYLNAVSRIAVEHCQFTAPMSGALLVNGSVTDVRFANNTVTGAGYGILVNDNPGNARLQFIANTFVGSGDASCADAIEINGVTNTIYNVESVGNTISGYTLGNGVTTGFGIAYANVTHGVISGNVIVGAGRNCIHIECSSKDITITGNSVRDARHAGIEVQGESGKTCSNIVISNNVVSNCCTNPSINLGNGGIDVGASTGAAFTGSGAAAILITGNLVEGCQSNGIYLFSVTNSSFVGNFVRGTYGLNTDTVRAIQNCGMYLISCTQSLVAMNRITDPQTTQTQYWPFYYYGSGAGIQAIGNYMLGNLAGVHDGTGTGLARTLEQGGLIQMDAASFVSKLGFYGATPTGKPTVTGARFDGTALDSLLTALSSLGLVTTSGISDGAVGTAGIASGAITSALIADSTITVGDMSPAALAGRNLYFAANYQ